MSTGRCGINSRPRVRDSKGKGRYSSSWGILTFRATGSHLPYGITQCYQPPDSIERAQPTPAMQAGTRFTYQATPEEWKAELT